MAHPALSPARAVTDTLGRPIRDLRVSLTDRCNFRCDYCMPAEIFGEHYEFLHRREILSFEEIERLVRMFVRFGVKKVRLTGGEPLLRNDVPALVEMLSKIDGVDDLTLTTNGYLLAKLAAPLVEAGLRRVTVSLDSLDDRIFRQMNGRDFGVEPVLNGIESAAAAGLNPVKINCVVIRGVNDHTIVDLARRFKGSGHVVRFIEYMDVGNRNNWNLSQVVTAREIRERIDEEFPLEPLDPNYRGEVANRFAYADGSGEIGIVASVSQPFCGDCSRAPVYRRPPGNLPVRGWRRIAARSHAHRLPGCDDRAGHRPNLGGQDRPVFGGAFREYGPRRVRSLGPKDRDVPDWRLAPDNGRTAETPSDTEYRNDHGGAAGNEHISDFLRPAGAGRRSWLRRGEGCTRARRIQRPRDRRHRKHPRTLGPRHRRRAADAGDRSAALHTRL